MRFCSLGQLILEGAFQDWCEALLHAEERRPESDSVEPRERLPPNAGTFETDVYELNVEIAGRSFLANFGVLPGSIASILSGTAGVEWIIGTDLLRQGVITFDLQRPRISAVWKAAQAM
jgi:hypothetical protein